MTRIILRSSVSLLEQDWTFRPSRAPLHIRALRLRHELLSRLPAPSHRVIRAPESHSRWNLLFLFLPTGTLNSSQRQIIDRVRALSGRLFIVFAMPPHGEMPAELNVADAIVFKDVKGFDLSAYALGLTLLARHSPGADVYVQNDSVFGPFADIDALVDRAPWDLTGFMASAAVENHMSTFAFILKDVTPDRIKSLSKILSDRWCFDDFDRVVLSQETRLARIASRSMSIGSFFYMPVRPAPQSWRSRITRQFNRGAAVNEPLDLRGDATLGSPLELLDRGFPFLKRSLFGKFSGIVDAPVLLTRLNELAWHHLEHEAEDQRR